MKEAIKRWVNKNVDFDHDGFIGVDLIHYDKEAVTNLVSDCLDDLRRSIEIEVIEDMASKVCPVSGYIIRNEQARGDLIDWAKTLRAVPPTK